MLTWNYGPHISVHCCGGPVEDLLLSFPSFALPQGRVQRAYRDMPTHSLQPQPVQTFWYLEHQNDLISSQDWGTLLLKFIPRWRSHQWLSMPCTPIPQPEGWWRVMVCRKSGQTFGTRVRMGTSYAGGSLCDRTQPGTGRGGWWLGSWARGPRAHAPQ